MSIHDVAKSSTQPKQADEVSIELAPYIMAYKNYKKIQNSQSGSNHLMLQTVFKNTYEDLKRTLLNALTDSNFAENLKIEVDKIIKEHLLSPEGELPVETLKVTFSAHENSVKVHTSQRIASSTTEHNLSKPADKDTRGITRDMKRKHRSEQHKDLSVDASEKKTDVEELFSPKTN